MVRLEYFKLYDSGKMRQWNSEDPIYFRFTPYRYDWIVLVFTTALISINKLFKDEKEEQRMYKIVRKYLETHMKKELHIFLWTKVTFRFFVIIILLSLMLYFIGRAQTNVINICFFTLNVINAMILAKNDNKDSTLRWAIRCSKTIMYTSVTVILVEYSFAMTIGMRETEHFPNSWDQRFKRDSPWLYDRLAFLGLRMIEDLDEMPIDNSVYLYNFQRKYVSYVVYLLVSKFYYNYLLELKSKSES